MRIHKKLDYTFLSMVGVIIIIGILIVINVNDAKKLSRKILEQIVPAENTMYDLGLEINNSAIKLLRPSTINNEKDLLKDVELLFKDMEDDLNSYFKICCKDEISCEACEICIKFGYKKIKNLISELHPIFTDIAKTKYKPGQYMEKADEIFNELIKKISSNVNSEVIFNIQNMMMAFNDVIITSDVSEKENYEKLAAEIRNNKDYPGIKSDFETAYAKGIEIFDVLEGWKKSESLLYEKIAEISTHILEVEKMGEELIYDHKELLFKKINTIIGIIILSIIIGVIIALILGYALSHQILKPINALIEGMKDMSYGERNLSRRLPMNKMACSTIKKCGNKDCPEYDKEASCWDTVGSNAINVKCPSILKKKIKSCWECSVMKEAITDEFEEMKGWFNTLLGSLNNIVVKVFHNAELLTSTSEDLNKTASDMSIGALSMKDKSTAVATETEKLTECLGNIADASGNVSSSVSSVAAAIEQMTSSLSEVAKNCTNASNISNKANQSSLSTSESMSKLNEASVLIGKVIETINDIADQTNLLALNATIEAASAGDAGKGFAVVANEVKELAKQTSQATEEIGRQIEDMQLNTKNSTDKIHEVSEIVKEMNSISLSIAAAVEEQNATLCEISSNLTKASQDVSGISVKVQDSSNGANGIAFNIIDVNSSAIKNSNGAETIKSKSKLLQEMSIELKNTINQFKH